MRRRVSETGDDGVAAPQAVAQTDTDRPASPSNRRNSGASRWAHAARTRTLRLSVLCALCVCVAPLSSATEILPREQVRAGMRGVGRTVFAGSRIEEFQVEILGVIENSGPQQSLIMARLTGGPLASTGVIAGMSGSPVFIDGKLIGAVAYGYPFSKETIAGITPIGEMIEATRPSSRPRAASTRLRSPFSALARDGGPRLPLDREALVASLRRDLPQVLLPGQFPAAVGALQPLALPLTFSGFDPAAFEWARGVFAGLGFAPVMGPGTAQSERELPALEPGAPIGISLVEGDLDVSVTGTVTHLDGGRVYAFGHPLYNLGPTQFPLRKAYVFSVFPSLYQSFKISVPGEVVGTFDQDRLTAVAGHLGPIPRLIPVEVELRTSRGRERTFRFRVVDDELFTPALTYTALLSILQGTERAYGTSSMHVKARVTLQDGRVATVEDFFTREQPAVQAAQLVAAPAGFLMANGFERLHVAKIDVELASYETVQTGELQRAWLERDGPVRPGSTLTLKLAVRTYRGETHVESLPVPVPDNAPAGAYTLVVADAPTLTRLDQQELQQAFVPKNASQLLRALNALRRGNRIYVRLSRPAAGAVVAGELLPGLPPSVLAVLGAGAEPGAGAPLGSLPLWELDRPVEYAFSGARALSFTVTR